MSADVTNAEPAEVTGPISDRAGEESGQPDRQLRAVPAPDEDLDGSARPGARDAVSISSAAPVSLPTAPNSASAPASTAEDSERIARPDTSDAPPVWVRLKSWAHPPNVTVEAAPSWQQIQWRARHGQHVATDGWTRQAALAWAFTVQSGVQAAAIWACWIARSPTRTAVAITAYLLLAHLVGGIPILSFLFRNPLPF